MAGQFGLDNIASLYDPSVAVDQLALQRRMEIAKALRQQSMTPVDTAGRQIGGMGYRVSPMEGIAKIVQALSAQHLDSASDADRLALSQKMAMALRGALDDGQPPAAPAAPPVDPNGGLPAGVTPEAMAAGGFPQPAPQSQPAPQAAPVTPSNRMTLASLVRGGIVNDIGGPAMGSAYAKNFETPEAIRVLNAEGVDPKLMGAATLGKAQKEASSPTRLGNGAYADSSGRIHGLPQAIPGSVNVQAPGTPAGWQTVPVPGATGAIEAESAAGALGKAQGTPFAGVGPTGQPLPVQSLADVLRKGSQVTPDVQASRDDKRVEILNQELARTTDPADRAAIQKEIGGTQGGTAYVPPKSGVYSAPPLGTEGAQKGLDTSWEALKSASREAQNTKSYLQNIVTAADKGAIVGPNADRREYIQGIFQLAGIKESVNTNAVTQTQLLDKYANQIVTRLGQGGLGTDAARAMLESAYPNKNMNVDAIHEAAANLAGAQDMVKAKARFLLDPATKRDTTQYQQRELTFDQNADPRIWQWASIQDPNARKAFLSQTLQQDPGFLDRVKTLKSLGALQ